VTRALKRCAAFALAVAWAAPASAQQYLIGADAQVSSGIEGGGAPGLFRTRTRLRLGADLRVDEFPDDILELGLLAEVEPRSGFGADVRYARAAGDHVVFDVGVLGILAPASLYGVEAGVTYRLPLSKRVQITLGPEGDFYMLGSDLPDRTVIWQLRFDGGVRVEL
jgi:hypothetical protein